jgi:hypothetical protein
MPFTADEEEQIIAELRQHGASVTTGASFAQTTWTWRGDRPHQRVIDEGHEDEAPSHELTLRAAMRAHPGPFGELLKGPALRALRAAWAAGDATAARLHLAGAQATGGPRRRSGALELALAEGPPSAEAAAAAREELRTFAAFHDFLRVIADGRRGPAVVRDGLWFADRLAAQLGDGPELEALRAAVRKQG